MNEARLKQYGYMPVRRIPRRLDVPMKLRFLPTRQLELMTINQFKYRVATGVIQPVEKEIGVSPYALDPDANGLLEGMGIKDWDIAGEIVHSQAAETMKLLWESVQKRKKCGIMATSSELTNRGKLYGMIGVLKRFRFDKKHLTALVIWRDGRPEYRYINQNTIHLLELLLQSGLITDANLGHSDYADSDKAVMFAGRHWDEMQLVFLKNEEQIREFDNIPRLGAGLFPYILTEPCADLSKFGIYDTFDPSNYGVNCVLEALTVGTPAISLSAFSSLALMLRTYTIPYDAFETLAGIIKFRLTVSHWCEKRGGIKEVKHYGNTAWEEIKLFERWGHVMRYQDDIAQKVEKLRKDGKLREMTADEVNLAIRAGAGNKLTLMYYPDFCVRNPLPPREVLNTEIDLILEHENVKCLPISEKIELYRTFVVELRQKWSFLRADKYATLAGIGQALLFYAGCFEGVVELRGTPYHFIRKCLKNAIIQPYKDKPVREEGKLMQIDRRGSYTAIYRDFLGIPMGKPVVLETLAAWKLGNWDYYYVCLQIDCILPSATGFDLPITSGLNWVDKVFYEHLVKNVICRTKFISGYGFNQGFNTKISEIAVQLWELRMKLKEAKSPLELVLKRMMNSLWGKSIAKIWDVKMRSVQDDKLVMMLRRNEGFVYEMHRTTETEWQVALARPIVKAYRMPQFGVNVLSASIVGMHSIIEEAHKAGIRVFYTNTDCLCYSLDDNEKMHTLNGGRWIGDLLGQFSYEFEVPSRKFICLSKKKYLHCFVDGKFRVRFPPKNVEEKDLEAWFERKYLEKTQE
jgi:hypothetical protein